MGLKIGSKILLTTTDPEGRLFLAAAAPPLMGGRQLFVNQRAAGLRSRRMLAGRDRVVSAWWRRKGRVVETLRRAAGDLRQGLAFAARSDCGGAGACPPQWQTTMEIKEVGGSGKVFCVGGARPPRPRILLHYNTKLKTEDAASVRV